MEMDAVLERALAAFRPGGDVDLAPLLARTLHVARLLQSRATELQTPQERRQQAELDRLLQSPHDKATLVQLTDQAFRSGAASREVDQLSHILDVQGVPRCFTGLEQALLRGFQSFGGYLPGVAAPLVKERMQHETANVVLPAEPRLLAGHLAARRDEGLRMNVNFLGEAILSEAEVERRMRRYLEALAMPEIEVLSVKISTLCSQISPLARETTLDILCDRLATLFRAAQGARFQPAEGPPIPKFVYLDMEEYRDMDLTASALTRTLDEPDMKHVRAGIALQAYLPDSLAVLQQLIAWAERRVADGGSPLTVRLVKGANMEMERVEAAIAGWEQAPFPRKVETDANFKRMLHEAMDHLDALRLGVASHNLFDVAYALVLAHDRGLLGRVQFEMLEGMANHQRRALADYDSRLLLYAPACRHEDFVHAIGYLIRRLDENTAEENFLRHAFRLTPGDEDWNRLEAAFLESVNEIPRLDHSPRRTQDRNESPAVPPAIDAEWWRLRNEPDTDWALRQNVAWAEQLVDRWRERHDEEAPCIPLVIAGREIFPYADREAHRDCVDPSRPGVVVGRYPQATSADVEAAMSCAAADPDGWRALSAADRQSVLRRVAQEVRCARGDLIGAAMADGGKIVAESDPEVSEAIDFLEFYAATGRWWHGVAPGALKAAGKGVVVVVSPWNFPVAIPCGGVAAALAAGNTVILKPASDAVLPAWRLCECFWKAGVSRRVLQFLPGDGGEIGAALVGDPRVAGVVLTGGTETALALRGRHPVLPLSAETGGKNATIVTALADRDQAIKHVLHSAFSHAGQKCSATSLLLLEGELYDDPEFRRALCEAAASLRCGSAWNFATRVNPLIRPPTNPLARALTTLDPGESWALRPAALADCPNCWTPGIKWDVRPGSVSHLTEFFGPVLSVLRFDKLTEAIRLVNGTGYGLTSALESLDDREQEQWRAGICAGNLYLNRTSVGAIVLRQPFGGLGKSAFGPGLKAGGPNYVSQFMHFTETAPPVAGSAIEDEFLRGLVEQLRDDAFADLVAPMDRERLCAAIADYDRAWRKEFASERDDLKIIGQDNLRRHLPVPHLRIRVHAEDSTYEVIARIAAARAAGTRPVVSQPPDAHVGLLERLHELTEHWAAAIEFIVETDEHLADIIRDGEVDRIRYAAAERVPENIHAAAAETIVHLATEPVLSHGRLELLHYLREQSISHDYHRYGNLGERFGGDSI